MSCFTFCTHIPAVPALSSEECLRGVYLSPSEGHIPFWHQRLRTADVQAALYNLQQNKQNHRIAGVDYWSAAPGPEQDSPSSSLVFFFLWRQELGPMLHTPSAQGCCFSGTWFSPVIWN
ncbi:hypothetical protein EK904_010676 [Melospiza melodia maxima]|nr:hypothetical protein EK904_010676 [Melospiza melodia maxima]